MHVERSSVTGCRIHGPGPAAGGLCERAALRAPRRRLFYPPSVARVSELRSARSTRTVGRVFRVPMPLSTWVEVDLDRFAANLGAVKRFIGPGREILLVVKADAYGHGAVEIAEAAAREGVACLGVATLHEGMQLRHAGCRLPV